MVRDSESEEESRYFAVNSYLPMYCSMRKGAICIRRVWQERCETVEGQIDRGRRDRIVAKTEESRLDGCG